MLRLECESHPAWIDCALSHFDEILIDHAHCEQKAALSALSFITKSHPYPKLTERLIELAEEELGHFKMVTALIHERGQTLGLPQKNPYVSHLSQILHSGPEHRLIDRLLVAAIIEARSCERLRLIARHHPEPRYQDFYDELWKSEAGHHAIFIDLATRLAEATSLMTKDDVKHRLKEVALHEALWITAQKEPLPIVHG